MFQIAAHEETFGLERLYEVCRVARRLVDPLNIGRVIARPFIGTSAGHFKRTAHRKDYSVPPPERTILDLAESAGRDIVTIGKIDDIFAHRATGRNMRGDGNEALIDATLDGLASLAEGGMLFANFIDFDTLYGHRRDVAGGGGGGDMQRRSKPSMPAFPSCLTACATMISSSSRPITVATQPGAAPITPANKCQFWRCAGGRLLRSADAPALPI
ncbi:hypothetical protein ACVWWG_008410 [Bradyrhizobium sp. LB7.2]